MKKVRLKWSFEIEKELQKSFLKITSNNFNNVSNKQEYEKVSNLLLKFTTSLNLKFKKLSEIDIEKHKEINKQNMKDIVKWSGKQKEYINNDPKYSKEQLKTFSKFRARNFKGNVYVDFLEEIVSEEVNIVTGKQ